MYFGADHDLPAGVELLFRQQQCCLSAVLWVSYYIKSYKITNFVSHSSSLSNRLFDAVDFSSHTFHVKLRLHHRDELSLASMGCLLPSDDLKDFSLEVFHAVLPNRNAQEVVSTVVKSVTYVSFPANLSRTLEGPTANEGNTDVAIAIGRRDLVDYVVSVVSSLACHFGLLGLGTIPFPTFIYIIP